MDATLTTDQQTRIRLLNQLDAAEHAKESFRQSQNWQRYSEMAQETARIGRLLMLGEQEKGQQ